MQSSANVYQPKIDKGSILTMFVVIAGSFLTILTIPPTASPIRMVLFVVLVIIWSIALPFMWPINYMLRDSDLVVRVGFIRREYPLGCISEVCPRSGREVGTAIGVKAAYSMGRLLITTTLSGLNGQVAISPKEKTAFMQDLQSRDPDLAFEGDCLRRKAG